MKTRTIIGTRPQEIPPSWPIHNAPRPIYGTKTWTGDFITGIFYAALDPEDEQATWMFLFNSQLDARSIVYVSQEDAVQTSKNELLALYPDQADTINSPDNEQWLINRYLDKRNNL